MEHTIPDLTFPRGKRLLEPAAFQRVFDQARWKQGSRHFLFLVIPNDLSCARLGMVIPRKRSRRSVDRSRIKRHLRESFRHRHPDLPGLDVVVLLRGHLLNPDPAALRTELEALWDKLLAKVRQA